MKTKVIKFNSQALKKIIFFTLSLAVFSNIQAQNEHQLIGVLQLEGNQIISYRLIFNEKDGVVSGFSVTDLQGEHETKNVIEGTYNKKTKDFFFKESDIVYTKSSFIQDDFCLVNFSGKVKLEKAELKLAGNFKGKFSDGEECISGALTLVGESKVYKRMNKLNKKIQRSKKVTEAQKAKINPMRMLDSLKLNTLKPNENTTVYWNSNSFKMALWDVGKEDGDKISVFVNGKKIINNYQIVKKKKMITLALNQKTNEIIIKAENEGEIAFNTAKVVLYDSKKSIPLFTNLKKGTSTKVTLIKR